MPFYEYICLDCGNAFEKPDNQIADEAQCPACGSAEIKDPVAASGTSASDCCTPKG